MSEEELIRIITKHQKAIADIQTDIIKIFKPEDRELLLRSLCDFKGELTEAYRLTARRDLTGLKGDLVGRILHPVMRYSKI